MSNQQTQQLDNLLEQTRQELRFLDTQLKRSSRVLPDYASLAASLGVAITMLSQAQELAAEQTPARSDGDVATVPLHHRQIPG